MKGKSKITSTLLALILSVTMIVTYMPASMIAYAANEADVAAEIEQSDTGTDVVTDDVLDGSEEADEADPAVSESNEQEEDVADVVDGDGADVIGEDQVDSAEVIPEEETDAEPVTEVEPKRATKATKTGTVLAFSSDVHNKSGNVAANRLGTWVDKVISLHGGIDVMAFGGDMANASASASDFWTLTKADMDALAGKEVPGLYTTGNHEYSPGGYSASSTNATQQAYKINKQGAEGSNYLIYCLGSNSSSSSYANQVSSLQSYLNGVGNDKVIFIITHFPLHYTSGRTTSSASSVIDALNNAATNGTEDTSDDKKIVFLWGHNHTNADKGETHYDEIFKPGDSLQYASGSSNTKTIQFYYAAAGCMSDSEYGTGSGAVEGKGLVVDINSKNQLKFTYYDESGNDVTEGGAYTEQDPVAATGISIDEITQTGDDGQPVVIESPTIEAGKRLQLSVTIEPADATNKDVTWSSSDSTVATVSSTGLVKGVSPGTATITASISDTAKRGTLTASVDVTITERTSEEQYYVIKIGDYALSSRTSSDRMTNTSGYEYYGLEGVEYSSAQAAPYKILWTLEPADGVENGFYIKSADGDYLSASYVRNSSSSSSYTGTLTLGNAEDIWIATSGLDAWEIEGSTLKSDKASHNANNNKEMFLADIEGDAGSNLFTVRSSSDTTVDRTSFLVEPEETLAKVSVTGITLNPTALSVEEGKTATIAANVVPTNADDNTVTWTSNDTSVATVDTAGKVTGVAVGNTTITARTQDGGFTANCSVTVTPRTTPRYELTNSLEDGGEYLIVSTRSPGSAYALKNPGTSGTNIANASYKTSVTIQSDQTVYIETEDADVVWTATTNGSGFNLTNNGLYLEGSGGNVGVYSSLNNSDRSWSYSSGNQLQHLGGSSTYTLRYRSSSNYFQGTTTANNSYTVFLFKKLSNAAVTGIMLDKSTADVSINGTVQLTATVEPANAGNKEVSWGSSDTSVATVDNTGKVTGVAEGTATITATSAANPSISASCAVTVSDVHVDDVSISPSPANVSINNSVQLTANITPENASNKNVTWASRNPSIATVDNSGKVTGVAEGEATITVTTEDGGKTATCTVTVTKQKAYVIIIGDYALSTDSSDDELVNSGSGSQVYHYHGLAGVEYTAGSAAADNIRWFLEETEGGYYIKSQDGRYLNATYGTNSTGGSDGVLKLDETKDVWVLDGTLESWALNGSKLKSTNANKSLTHEETSNGNAINLFTVRSTGETTELFEAPEPVEATDITVTPAEKAIYVGEEAVLTAAVTPDNATNSVSWSSSSPSVVTVDETGKVTGIDVGTATITASIDDVSATCIVTVNPIAVESVILDKTTATVQETKTLQLNATVLPENATDKTVTWTSSNPSVATVDETGMVTGVATGGTATITATAGGKSATCEVNVTEYVAPQGYVIVIENNALSTDAFDGYLNTSTGYYYYGLTSIPYDENTEITDNILWIIEETNGGYYIKSQDGRYLSATYVSESGNTEGRLSLGSTKDVWTISGSFEDWMVDGSTLTSTNSGKSLTNETGTLTAGGTGTLFTIRSTGENSTVVDPENPIQVETRYVETDSFVDGKNYIIAVGDGSNVYAVKNIGTSSSNTTSVELIVQSANGADSPYIVTDDTGVVWKYASKNQYMTNNSLYLSYNSTSPNPPRASGSGRAITYSSGKLQIGSRYLTCDSSGSFGTTSSSDSAASVRIFEERKTVIPSEHTHTYGTPTYTWADDNSTCTATAVCSGCEEGTDGHSVTETVEAAYEVTTPASCTAAGTGTYTATFNNELFAAQTKTVEIPTTAHNTVHHPAVPATCTEDGTIEYYSCSVCNKNFSDEAGTDELTSIVDPATGHDWDGPVWNWTATETGYTATATFTCKNDTNHKETNDAEVTKTSGGGQTTYTATVTGPDGNTYTDTKSVVDEEYNLWVNGIRVNSVNKNDIMGSGEASYDPVSMTLTLNNATITEPYTLSNNDVGLIYSDLGSGTTLTIKGTASMIPAGSSSSDGIRIKSGNLTFDGEDTNITAKSKTNVINAGSSTVTFNNGTVDCETTTDNYACIYGKNIVVNDGELTAASLANVISGDKIDVNGGEVTAVSTGTSGGSSGFTSKVININGGMVNVNARSRDLYAHNAGSINIIGGIVNLNGSNVGIYGSNSSLTISGGTVTSASSINVDHEASISGGTVHLTGDSARIYVKRNLTISGENTVVELDKGTIETIDGLITIESPLGIVLPTNYVISSNGKKLVDEETDRAEATHILISKPILLTVTFNNQGHGVKPADITNVRYGTTIESPGDLEEDGWVFGGWYKEAACTNLFDFTAPITENTTIFAKWTRVTTYPISFVDEDGVTELETQNVASGATPVYGGTTPAKAADADYRYEFAGWTPEITAVTGPATYTAVYTKIARTYGDPVWVWAEDRRSATATFTTNDGAEAFSKTATDNAPAKSVVPATCEEAGKTVYTATVTFKEQTYTNTQEDVIPATGHDYGVPTYVWADDYSTVTATRVCANDSSHVETETATTTYAVVTPATDTTSGTGRYTSKQFGNEAFAVQTMDVEIPPTGYDVSYVWNKTDDGYTVTGTAVPFDTSAQTITETVDATYAVTTPATCTAPGEGTWTSAAFTKSQFAVQTKKEPIEALDHDLAATAAKAATCDEAGNSAYWTCSRCGKFFSDAEGETEIAKDSWIIPAIGHDWNAPIYVWAEDNSTVTATRTCKHDASHTETETATVTSKVTKPATCEAKGETTYTATFTNTAFVAQTKTVANIDATGHNWNEPTYTWAADNSAVTATRTCKNDPVHVETEIAETTSEVTKPATCEAKGETTYTATFTNTAFATRTKTEANIPALGHDWGTPTYEWASDNSKVTATRTCKNDATHVETETVQATYAVTTPASCTTDGEGTWTSASFTNTAFAVQTKTETIAATGHDWDTANIEWTWAADYSTATATFTCKNDANHKNVLTAEVSSTTTEATCVKAGETRYRAVVTLNDGMYADTKTVVIPALGHDWNAPAYAWAADNSKVTATRTCKNDATHVETETVQATYAVTTPASCTTDGEGTWTSAAFENEAFTVQTKTETIAATGHDWNDPTYEWTSDNSKVTATRTCQNDSSHVETETVGATYEEVSPATDTEAGSGKWTSAAFENEAFEVQTLTVVLPPMGYNVTYEWTKTADGYTVKGTAVPYNTAADTITETVDATYEVTTQATCEAEGVGTWTSAAFENSQFGVQTKTEAIGVLGHDPVKTDATAATCEAAGNNAYWTCSRCGKFFSDAEGKTEISEGSWIILATGHDWGEPTYTWAADNSKVTATRTCGNDADHVQTETVNTTSEVTKAATCETKGETTYTSAAFENEAFAVQTKTVANIDATGHNWNEPTYTWAADNSAVTATRTCKNDPVHVETEIAETTSEVTKPATCEAKGETTYTATFTNSAFAVQSKTLENVEPIGHDWNAPTYTWAADNSAVTATRTCKHDASHKQIETVDATGEVTKEPTCVEEGEKVFTSEDFTNEAFAAQTKTVVLDATGHSFRQTNAKPATCTEDGNITYYTCTKCGKHFSYEDGTTELVDNKWVIPKFGHDWDEPVYEWAADNSRVTATRICKNDEKHIESETVNAVKVTTPATCEADGVTTYTATFTNEAFETQTRTITIDAIGHSWNAPTYTWAADNSTVTATRTCANNPAHVETETVNATYAVTTPATETEAGVGTWTSAAFENEAFAVQTKTVEISPTGYEVSYEWNKTDDGYTVTGTAVPLDTSAETIYETVAAKYVVTTPAKCTTAGVGTWATEAFENPQFKVQVMNVEIDMLGHDLIMSEAHGANCEQSGNNAYWTCSRCGKFFSDTIGNVEISDGDWVTPATGHDWSEPNYTWAEDNSKVTATRICGNDADHVQTETVNTTSEVTKAATCEAKGETTYTSAAFTNSAFAVQTKTETIAATGHDWNIGNILWTWADDFGSATARFTCRNDGSHNETVNATVTSATTNPSCETAGKTVYTAVATFNGADYSDVKEKEIPATGHDWNAPTYEWAADNSTVTATCACKNNPTHVETETVNTTSEMTEPVTCEADGAMTYTATFASEVFETQIKTITIDATGHDWSEATYTWADDSSTVTATRVCKSDPAHVETETASATYKVTTPATETAAGEGTWSAEFENAAFEAQTKTVEIPPTGTPEPTPAPGSDPNQGGAGGPVGPGASAASAERAITGMTSDTDLPGAAFGKLMLRSPKQTKTSIQLNWMGVSGASKYVIYGNRCGKGNKPVKVAEVTGSTITFSSLAKGTYYKYVAVALDSNNNVVSTSKLIHVATKGGKVGNHKSVKVQKSVTKKAKKLKVGKSLKLKAKAVPQSKKLKVKKHVGVRYESSDPSIATVSSKGKVKGVRAGTCYVYAYAQNGVFKTIKITVK